ncbi:hypothetical protein [Nonomuraea sp. NPDC003754]
MDAQEIHDLTKAVLKEAKFVVHENDNNIPTPAPFPGDACLFLQQGQVRLYLLAPTKQRDRAARAAATALATERLRAVGVTASATADSQTIDVLFQATGQVVQGRDPAIGPFSEGWGDQYRRMVRSFNRLLQAAGPSTMDSAEARDFLFHFFQDAYHLKEWIKNDPDPACAQAKREVEDIFDKVKGVPALQVAADLCNGLKHLRLTASKTGDKKTTFNRQHVSKEMPVFVTSWFDTPARPYVGDSDAAVGSHRWEVVSNGKERDAISLADEVVAEWQRWLEAKSLLSSPPS